MRHSGWYKSGQGGQAGQGVHNTCSAIYNNAYLLSVRYTLPNHKKACPDIKRLLSHSYDSKTAIFSVLDRVVSLLPTYGKNHIIIYKSLYGRDPAQNVKIRYLQFITSTNLKLYTWTRHSKHLAQPLPSICPAVLCRETQHSQRRWRCCIPNRNKAAQVARQSIAARGGISARDKASRLYVARPAAH